MYVASHWLSLNNYWIKLFFDQFTSHLQYTIILLCLLQINSGEDDRWMHGLTNFCMRYSYKNIEITIYCYSFITTYIYVLWKYYNLYLATLFNIKPFDTKTHCRTFSLLQYMENPAHNITYLIYQRRKSYEYMM